MFARITKTAESEFRSVAKSLVMTSQAQYSSQIDVEQLASSSKTKKKSQKPRKRTICDIEDKYRRNKKLTMVTAYDFPTARFINQTDMDMILVGDSMAMVVLGMKDTTSIELSDMLVLSKAVARGAPHKFLIGDLPFGSYEISDSQAASSAIQYIQAGMHAVKLEGGARIVPRVKAMVAAGVNVIGHIGLTPQSAHRLGGFKVQGKACKDAMEIMDDALALQDAGCRMLVIECIPDKIAKLVTQNLEIPTIGIGSGVDTSGQVLVFHDMMGMFDSFSPRFSKQFVSLGDHAIDGLNQFVDEVQSKSFPSNKHAFGVKDDVMDDIFELAAKRGLKTDLNDWYDPQHPSLNTSDSLSNSSSSSILSTNRSATSINSKRHQHTHAARYIAVIGAGSMGMMIAGKLTKGNEELDNEINVTLVDPNVDKITHLRNNGIHLHHSQSVCKSLHLDPSPLHIQNINFCLHPSEMQSQVDLIVLLTKSHATETALHGCREILHQRGIAITLQNGLGNTEQMAKELGTDRVVQGITSVGACRGDHIGHVTMTGVGDTFLPNLSNPIVHDFARLLSNAHIQCEVVSKSTMEDKIMSKLLINAAINPVAALKGVQNGQLLQDEQSLYLMRNIVQEGIDMWDLQHKSGRIGSEAPSFDHAWDQVITVIERTQENLSSMTQDLLAGRPTEIDVINGAIVRMANQVNLQTPFNEDIVARIKSKQT